MEIQIGMQNINRELSFEVDLSAEELTSKVNDAINGGVLTFTDSKGRHVNVVGSTIAYVTTGAAETRSVGFGRA